MGFNLMGLERAQHPRVFTALAEDPVTVPSINMVSHNHQVLQFWESDTLFWSQSAFAFMW